MSTTADRSVAAHYASSGNAATILELEQGMVDRGAELSWLSQYPYEREVCNLSAHICLRMPVYPCMIPSLTHTAHTGALCTTDWDRDAQVTYRGLHCGRRDGPVGQSNVTDD
jgi:hypothetical protein